MFRFWFLSSRDVGLSVVARVLAVQTCDGSTTPSRWATRSTMSSTSTPKGACPLLSCFFPSLLPLLCTCPLLSLNPSLDVKFDRAKIGRKSRKSCTSAPGRAFSGCRRRRYGGWRMVSCSTGRRSACGTLFRGCWPPWRHRRLKATSYPSKSSRPQGRISQ